ncbi:MAG: cytochrome c maturation protein CcmE [Pseudomonadales bacterium]|nr:cytochrome c maturation protein CcmE [Pseudomonadales bacterium]
MLAHRKQRLLIVGFIICGSALAVGLMLFALNKGINVFFTPTEISEGLVPAGQNIRIGGMVKPGSLKKAGLEGTRIEFIATDFNKEIPVTFTGVLPDLFREGQGVVADGYMDAQGMFQAAQILAKHDENYMSAEVKAALVAAEKKQAGVSDGP